MVDKFTGVSGKFKIGECNFVMFDLIFQHILIMCQVNVVPLSQNSPSWQHQSLYIYS